MAIGRVLYNNVIKGITPTFSGTTLSGKPPSNATDWADYSYFTADSGNLDFTMATDTDIDSVSIYVKTVAGSNSIELQYESAPATFTSLKTFSSPSGTLDYEEFSGVTVSSGRKIRFVITAATTIDIRQLVVGERLEFEQGAWATVTPASFLQGVKVTNNISENGSVLGRSIKRLERSGKISLDHLTDSWVRASWEPFAYHFARYPFIFVWDYSGHADDVAFAFAEGVNPPQHGTAGRLSAEVSIKFLVADSLAV